MAEGDWPWDLNPCMAAMPGWDHAAWAEKNWGLFGTMKLGQRTSDFYFFFGDMVPWTGQRGKEGLCVCGYSKGL